MSLTLLAVLQEQLSLPTPLPKWATLIRHRRQRFGVRNIWHDKVSLYLFARVYSILRRVTSKEGSMSMLPSLHTSARSPHPPSPARIVQHPVVIDAQCDVRQ